jgi:K+-sensing histidine kinase KdpD
VWISKKEIEKLSADLKTSSRGNIVDIRDNKEGAFSILKNDLYTYMNQKNEELKITEKERDVLADYMADISHQLKTPITSMMIMADLMEEAPKDKQVEFLKDIKISLSKMEWLVSTLLKMAKIDAKAISFSKESVKVSELLKRVMPGVEVLLDVRDQSVELKNDAVIQCDLRWTAEALSNVIKNAAEHSPNGGVITVDSGTNPMYEWRGVTDSGEGLKKENYKAMFNRFSYSTGENGYGIGIPFALTVIKGQGGDIDVDFGGNGIGATFTLKFYK